MLAGIIPGLVLTVLFMLAIGLITTVNPELGAAGPRTTWRERLLAIRDVWEVLALFLVVIGGLYIGGMARDVPLATIYRGIMLFLLAQIVLLVLLTRWPGMALMLPGTMK